MARYIDADALIAEYDRVHIGAPGGARKLMVEAPTVDVVPKSEVAAEIEMLENKVGKIYNHYVFEDNDYADDDVAVEAAMNALTEVLNLISEFREKYTEEK